MDELEEFITQIYITILGRPPDPGGLKGWVYLIKTKQIKKECLAKELTNHEEYKQIPQPQPVAPVQIVARTQGTQQKLKNNNSDCKVAFIMENFNFYSGGRYLSYMIALAFQEIGFDVTLYTDKKPTEIPYINNDDFKDYKKIRIEHVPDLDKLSFSGQSHDIYVGAPTDGCVVAHREAMKNKKPFITFLFDVPPFMKKYGGDLDKGWVSNPVWDKVSETLKNADLIFTFSKALVPYIQEFGKLSINKIKVFHPLINSRACAKAVGGKKKRQVLMVNRFVNNKHWDHLFEALSKINNPPTLIAITRSENEIEGLSLKYEVAVECIGYADDLTKFKLMKESAVVVNPSSYEGLSMSTTEAIACNTPCIVYEFPVIRDIFGEKGMSYAKYLDPMDLKAKIEAILDSKEIQDSKAAEARSVEHLCTFDNFAEELFEELFAGGLVERGMG